jgi:hypothetical protein
MRNPFKTRKILLVSPHRVIQIEIPFLGKIRFIRKIAFTEFIETGNIKGQVYEGIIVDEAVKMKKNSNKLRYYAK